MWGIAVCHSSLAMAAMSGRAVATNAVALGLLLIAAAFLAAAETSLVRANRHRVRSMKEEKVRTAELLESLIQKPEQCLSVILLLTLLVHIAASSIATSMAIQLGLPRSEALATGVMTLLIFIFSEMAPKNYAAQHPEKVALLVSPVISLASRLLYPLVRLLVFISHSVIRLFGGKISPEGPLVTEGELRAILSAAEEEEVIEEEEKKLIHSIFELGDTLVREVMVPRTDMVMLEENTGLEEALEVILRTGYSRIPVYRKDFDHITGILYAKDLLPYLKRGESDIKLSRCLREAYFIPETKKVIELLSEMRLRRIHMAVVLDEYGGTAGLVTIEDLLEEIVGEIFDEYDIEQELFEKLDDRRYVFDARISIDDLNELLGLELPSEEWDSLGGLMYSLMGKIPKQGETVVYSNLRLTAHRVLGKRIYKVLLEILDKEEAENRTGEGEEAI